MTPEVRLCGALRASGAGLLGRSQREHHCRGPGDLGALLQQLADHHDHALHECGRWYELGEGGLAPLGGVALVGLGLPLLRGLHLVCGAQCPQTQR